MSGNGNRAHSGQAETGIVRFVAHGSLSWLLLFVPVSIVLALTGVAKLWVFLASAVAIIPLAALIGDLTEQIGHRTGPGIGGLLNATLGNLAELIIAILALREGLHEVVKASISGSIIGNILLVLGLSMFVGGLGRQEQKFNRAHAGASSAMLFLAVVALAMPAVFDLSVYGTLERSAPPLQSLSILVAVVLIVTYLASLVFALRTHPLPVARAVQHAPEVILGVRNSVLLLAAVTAVTAWVAELLVGSISVATETLGMTEFFVGAIVVAVVSNAAEHFSAVIFAKRDQMDLAVTIAIGSSTQIALFVAPVLVFLSLLFGPPLSLVFNAFEVTGITLSVLALTIVALDGRSNWFEGLQLVAVYVVLAIVFFFVPASHAVP